MNKIRFPGVRLKPLSHLSAEALTLRYARRFRNVFSRAELDENYFPALRCGHTMRHDSPGPSFVSSRDGCFRAGRNFVAREDGDRAWRDAAIRTANEQKIGRAHV